jgi:phosphoribosylformylglycinamidine synthase
MPDLLTLRGRNALSDFRLKKLTQALSQSVPAVAGISAEYWHFASLRTPLTETGRQVLERILEYGPASAPVPEQGRLLLVVPRLGTISPWSSKATDIARSCGLDAVERIERGIAYHVVLGKGRKTLPASDLETLLPLIHDRMTETVLDSLEQASRLFQQVEPGALATIDLMGGGRRALEQANRRLGLALSDD